MPTDDVEDAVGWYPTAERVHRRKGRAPFVVFSSVNPSGECPHVCLCLAGWREGVGYEHPAGRYPTLDDMPPGSDHADAVREYPGSTANIRLTIEQAQDLMEELALAIGKAVQRRKE